ncbi:MAG: FKBP-type peptidyl-prolyl cis-trans isomerase [Candidatus Aenigmarchaeota archaeon]|nr:FKBP-type peptidyl-prolyl cis-trans isomerase [Candidatus Aenigmarchaeota archaeon]
MKKRTKTGTSKTKKQKSQNTKKKTQDTTAKKAKQKKEHPQRKKAPEKQAETINKTKPSPKLIITAIIIAAIALYMFLNVPDTDTQDLTNAVKTGDTVYIKFTQKLEDGTIIETNYETLAKEANITKDKYPPLTFKIGEGLVPRGLENALIGMKTGDKKTITIEPKEAYGEHIPELVGIAERIQHKERNITVITKESLTSKEFQEIFQKRVAILGDTVSTFASPWDYTITGIKPDNITIKAQIKKGDTYTLPDMQLWNSTAIEIKENEAIFRQNPKDGTIVPTRLGNATITTSKDLFTLTINPKIGDIYFLDNIPAKVTKLNSTHITLDANHPFAGKTIIFDIELLQKT